jgi:hypothetical protein
MTVIMTVIVFCRLAACIRAALRDIVGAACE